MKTLAPHYVGDWESRGAALRLRGLNRLGDLLVPNLNYVALEEWFMPLLRAMHDEQGGGRDHQSAHCLVAGWRVSLRGARCGGCADASRMLAPCFFNFSSTPGILQRAGRAKVRANKPIGTAFQNLWRF